jgi:signal transduction histidine kinase
MSENNDNSFERYYLLARTARYEALGAFARKISHDFNNILQILNGRLELIEQAPGLPAEVIEDARSALAGMDQAYRLMRQLRAYILLDELPEEAVDLNLLIADLVALYRPLLPNIIFHVEQTETALPVWGNGPMLETAIGELLHNAAEAMHNAGTIRIWCEAKERKAASLGEVNVRQGIMLHISDEGSGFATTELAVVSDPFYSTQGPRRGMGLTVVTQIVRHHEGYIELANNPERGATIRIWLPVHR